MRNSEVNVRPTSGGYSHQLSTSMNIGTKRVLTMKKHTRPLGAQVDTNKVFIGG